MAKYVNRLAARLAREALRESKSWVVSKKLILETEEGDMELEKGEIVDLGATADGDLAVKGNAAAVVVVSDLDLAKKIADIVVSSDELSEVEFVTKDAVETVTGGEDVEDVIGKLADEEPDATEVEVAEIDVDKKESVDAKFEKFAANPIHFEKAYHCESILVDEADDAPIDMETMTMDPIAREDIKGYTTFRNRIMELDGSIEPGVKEVALNKNGKVIGYFDKETDSGVIYPQSEFDSQEEVETFDAAPEALVQDPLAGEEEVTLEAIEEALKAFEESAMSGKDYIAMVEAVEKTALSEATVAKIAGSYNHNRLVEGCRIFDTKLGKHVCVKESGVDADNWIEEAGAEKGRFTKRFFG